MRRGRPLLADVIRLFELVDEWHMADMLAGLSGPPRRAAWHAVAKLHREGRIIRLGPGHYMAARSP